MSISEAASQEALSEVKVRVPAKINLALCVGPLGDDGYHPLGTIFHAVSLFDEVIARAAEPGQVTLQILGDGVEGVPVDDSNLALKAARLLIERYDVEQGVELILRKRIPVAGGMAGGSADAAGTLLACAILWDLDTAPEDLHELAAELGSDVPFALHGGNAIGTGRGTELVPMLTRGACDWVLAVAHEGLSTPKVFAQFDELGVEHSTDIPEALMNALAKGDVDKIGKNLRNDLQEAAISLRPELGEIIEAGLAAGAVGAVLCGSGPTVALLAKSEAAAMDLAVAILKHPHVRETRRASGPVTGARTIG